MNKYILYEKGYEPFIDFLKGYFILCILFTHSCEICPSIRTFSLYPFWGCTETGCFLLICSMHIFRKGLGGAKFDIKKIIKKFFIPFLLIQAVWLAVQLTQSENPILLLKIFFANGGFGGGSYFPWVFIQYYVFVFAISPLIKKIQSDFALCLIFVLSSMIIEFFCSVVNVNEIIYRLLAIRYFFLIFLSFILIKYGIKITPVRMISSLTGLVFIFLLSNDKFDFEPLIFNSGWKLDHWIIYPYLFFLLYVLYKIYSTTPFSLVNRAIMTIGKGSYGIFLCQMVYFSLSLKLSISELGWAYMALYIVFSLFICSISGLLLHKVILSRL